MEDASIHLTDPGSKKGTLISLVAAMVSFSISYMLVFYNTVAPPSIPIEAIRFVTIGGFFGASLTLLALYDERGRGSWDRFSVRFVASLFVIAAVIFALENGLISSPQVFQFVLGFLGIGMVSRVVIYLLERSKTPP